MAALSQLSYSPKFVIVRQCNADPLVVSGGPEPQIQDPAGEQSLDRHVEAAVELAGVNGERVDLSPGAMIAGWMS